MRHATRETASTQLRQLVVRRAAHVHTSAEGMTTVPPKRESGDSCAHCHRYRRLALLAMIVAAAIWLLHWLVS